MNYLLSFLIATNLLFKEKYFSIEDHKSLNDSIIKYIETNPNKSLDYGFEILKLANLSNPNRELVSTYNLIGHDDLDSTIISLLPLLIFPNETIPSISETTAGFDGFLASNNSVTLGRPPVISPDLPATLGILAMISPRAILAFS